MDFAGFAAELRGKKALAPVYVFAGAEALLRDRAVALLAESDPELGANLIRLASSETDWARVADELYTPPFLAKKKLVVLVDEGNFVHNHAEAIRGYLKQPSVSNILAALVPTEKVPALAGACLVECRSLKPGDLQRWLSSEAQRTYQSPPASVLSTRAGRSEPGRRAPTMSAGSRSGLRLSRAMWIRPSSRAHRRTSK